MTIPHSLTKLGFTIALFSSTPFLLLGVATGIWAPCNLYRLLVVIPLERRLKKYEDAT